MSRILVKSYSKINIGLSINGKREDGYHLIDTIMVPLEFHDSLRITTLKNAIDDYVTTDNFSDGIIEHNIASKAIGLLAEKYHFETKFRVDIHKLIPMKAGMGGGSSNGAATIIGVNKLLKLGMTNEEMEKVAVSLGADVPFFINPKPLRCTGIGEVFKPIEIKNDYYVLIVKTIKKGCKTQEVYNKFDILQSEKVDMDNIELALKTGDDDLLEKSLGNSLFEAASSIAPEIKDIIDLLKRNGLKIVAMTGSGSAVFALSREQMLMKKIINQLDDRIYFAELTKIKR